MKKISSVSRFLFATCFVLMLTACIAKSSAKLTDVNIGMTKEEVVKILGKPNGVGADSGREYMNYRLREGAWEHDPTPYTVVLENGKVVSYGRHGQVK